MNAKGGQNFKFLKFSHSLRVVLSREAVCMNLFVHVFLRAMWNRFSMT